MPTATCSVEWSMNAWETGSTLGYEWCGELRKNDRLYARQHGQSKEEVEKSLMRYYEAIKGKL